MRTLFTTAQLTEPATAAAAAAIRNCVHCGFCTATCPTYVLLGDELDSPRGRIYLVKEMLEKDAAPSPQVVKHVDRCLSCLACETHCPSGVSYRRIIDKGRTYIESHYRRPWRERLLRAVLAAVLPYRGRFRVALYIASLARPLSSMFRAIPALRPMATMLRLAREAKPLRRVEDPLRRADDSPRDADDPLRRAGNPARHTPSALRRQAPRIGLARGCIEPVLDPGIQAAAERLLLRAGCEVVRAEHDACCGALSYHMGREQQALGMARASVDAWHREIETTGSLDAIVVTASGCGTLIRDYGHLLKDDPRYAIKAARVSALACDITELFERIGLPTLTQRANTVVAYHPACSLQHGQQVRNAPQRLLEAAGFSVRLPADAHLCCGSAGVYNILQPDIAAELGARKAASLGDLDADVIATGNIGCRVQIGLGSLLPVVHVAELLDWATGGPRPF
jgi:glycolate oxidase iron-sulfur subunit